MRSLAACDGPKENAAEDARHQLMDVASQILKTSAIQLTVENGSIVDRRKGKRTPIRDVLAELGSYMIVGRGARAPNPQDKNVNTFGVQYAVVEVDLDSGRVKVLKIAAIHESGRVINPLTAHSQLIGGIIQGLGFALTEKRRLDPRIGIVVNPDLDHYKIPTSEDIPQIVAEMIDLPDPEVNNIGAKGMGEPPIIAVAAAVANAVADALGQRICQLPLSPDYVLGQLQDQTGSAR